MDGDEWLVTSHAFPSWDAEAAVVDSLRRQMSINIARKKERDPQGIEAHDNPSLPVLRPRMMPRASPHIYAQDPVKVRKSNFYQDPVTLGLVIAACAALVVIMVGLAVYRRRKRLQKAYEQFPEEGISRTTRINSRASEAAIQSCIANRNGKSIDFVVPSMGAAMYSSHASLASPVDTASISSGSSADGQLSSRLSLQDGNIFGAPGGSLFGGLNPELYKVGAEEPMEEIDFPDGHRGRLWFGFQYDAATERLVVNLIQVKNLPSRVRGSVNCCDPFVRLFLMPDERRYVQSKIKKKTCNPKFEESFIFQIPVKMLEERTLKFTVFDNDRGKRHNVIGHVLVPLSEDTISGNENIVSWRDLETNPDEVISDFGELLISLCYNQNLERMTVTICEAKDMKLPDGLQTVDSYVKISFLVENKVLKTKKTATCKRSAEPKYNESFNFKLNPSGLNTASVLVHVCMTGTGQKDKCLGRIVLGSFMFARGKALEHWNQTMSAGHRQIRYWHKLT